MKQGDWATKSYASKRSKAGIFYEKLGWKVLEVIPGMTSASFLMNKALARSIPLDLSTLPVSSAYKSQGATRRQIFAFSEDISL
jgi:hypothetical protein